MKRPIVPNNSDLKKYKLFDTKPLWNLPPEELQRITIEKGMGRETKNGTLAINTGKFTGRSPQDRFLVKDDYTKDKVWWGDINQPVTPENFDKLYDEVSNYLSGKELYVRDGYVCADPKYRKNIRTITEYPWSNMFVYNMFLRPEDNELVDFEEDWLILCAPGYLADPKLYGIRQENFSILNFTRKIALVGGSGYTGEMKKGIFSALNMILPTDENVLPMHCSANQGKDGETALFFGLSGTGKTTLSTDPERKLIGDDEHGWTDENRIFNFEGGCYAKVIKLSKKKEPDIYEAIKPGAILENVIFKKGKRKVDYKDDSITPNTRVSYPIDHIENIKVPSYGDNPTNVFFLTADAFGVLPPMSRLTPGQAAYHFISGYTAKVAGTEAGVVEPQPIFSACFGAPFMPLHPTKYATMLEEKMEENNTIVWLINTGWSGGPYGVGSRIKLKYTRAMITAILEGKLKNEEFHQHPVFGLYMPKSCPNVDDNMLDPVNTWEDKAAYEKQALHLAKIFNENFEQFASEAPQDILDGGPLK